MVVMFVGSGWWFCVCTCGWEGGGQKEKMAGNEVRKKKMEGNIKKGHDAAV